MTIKHTEFKTSQIQMSIYRSNHRVGIQLLMPSGAPYAMLSTNVEEIPLLEGEFIVKNWSENKGLDDMSLYPKDTFVDTGKRIDVSAFCVNVPIWRIPE